MRRGIALLDGQSDAIVRTGGKVFALVLGIAERARLRAALRGHHDVHFVERGCELLALMKTERSSVSAVMLEMRDADGRSTHDIVRQISVSEQSPPVLAYCRAGGEQTGEIRNFVLAGVCELVFDGVDDAGVALRALVSSAQQIHIGERVANALLATLPPILGPFVRYVTAHPDTQRVADVAEALGYNRKTLVNHCTQAVAPPPQELLAWCRLSVVAELLSTTPRTVESIALQLDFPSDTALRNMMKRYTGLRATDVRTHGGLRCVMDALAIELVIRGGKQVAIA
jgi:AraC-like DNA-binding protein